MLARSSISMHQRLLMNPRQLKAMRSAFTSSVLPSCGMRSSRGLLIAPGGATRCAKRHYVGEAVLPGFVTHCTQIGACTSLSTLLYSPMGTAMMVVLAYNVVVICTKHVNYSLEITAKDYVQDQQLFIIMRYGILCCILLGMEVMFVEV